MSNCGKCGSVIHGNASVRRIETGHSYVNGKRVPIEMDQLSCDDCTRTHDTDQTVIGCITLIVIIVVVVAMYWH